MENKKSVESMIVNFSNGDRETVEGDFIFLANDDNNLRTMTKCSTTTALTSALSVNNLLVKFGVLKEETEAKIMELYLKDFKEYAAKKLENVIFDDCEDCEDEK